MEVCKSSPGRTSASEQIFVLLTYVHTHACFHTYMQARTYTQYMCERVLIVWLEGFFSFVLILFNYIKRNETIYSNPQFSMYANKKNKPKTLNSWRSFVIKTDWYKKNYTIPNKYTIPTQNYRIYIKLKIFNFLCLL